MVLTPSRRRLSLAVATCVGTIAVSGTVGCSDSGGGARDPLAGVAADEWLVAENVPSGLVAAGAARFPEDHPLRSLGRFSVTLYESPDGDYGVIARDRDDGEEVHGPESGAEGPSGLATIEAIDDNRWTMVASRELPTEGLAAIAASRENRPGHEVERMDDSPIPGIGSLTIPAGLRGTATSWTEGGGDSEQRSLAVGQYQGGDPTAVLEWWFGVPATEYEAKGGLGHLITAPAYAAVGGPSAPEASLVVFVRDGWVTLVRAVGIDADELRRAVDSLRVTGDDAWDDLRPASAPQDDAATIDGNLAGADYRLTVLDGEPRQFCLALASSGDMTCTTASDRMDTFDDLVAQPLPDGASLLAGNLPEGASRVTATSGSAEIVPTALGAFLVAIGRPGDHVVVHGADESTGPIADIEVY